MVACKRKSVDQTIWRLRLRQSDEVIRKRRQMNALGDRQSRIRMNAALLQTQIADSRRVKFTDCLREAACRYEKSGLLLRARS